MQDIQVLNSAGLPVLRVHPERAIEMLKVGLVTLNGKRRVMLKPIIGRGADDVPAGRTHTSRGGLLGAVGRSQQYTISERQLVKGFKTIFPEDHHIFCAAVLDSLRAA